MKKFEQLQKIKDIYAQGGNIIQYLKSIGDNDKNTIEDILISYDFQAGSYVKGFAKNQTYNRNYCGALAQLIDRIEGVESLMEVGVGEATTLNTVVRNLKQKPAEILGFDISWSRLKFAKELLQDLGIEDVRLFTANLFETPLLDSSIDVVYTSHSIEPNGGKEEEALKELYRITKKYLILLEPSFEFASSDGKARMKKHGYVTRLHEVAKNLGFNIVEHRLFDYCSNPLNPTGLMVIKKDAASTNTSKLVCPMSHTDLTPHTDCLLYSKDSFLAYPILDKIPCLLKENSILATHLQTDYQEYKKKNDIVFSVDN